MSGPPITPLFRDWLQQGADHPEHLLPRKPSFLKAYTVNKAVKAGWLEALGMEHDPTASAFRGRKFRRYRITAKGIAELRGEAFY